MASSSFSNATAASNLSDTTVSLASSSPLVLNNIVSLVPIKLDGANYLMWKSLFELILRSQNLMNHIEGCPPDPSAPEFSGWYVVDQSLFLLFRIRLVSNLQRMLGISFLSVLDNSPLLTFCP